MQHGPAGPMPAAGPCVPSQPLGGPRQSARDLSRDTRPAGPGGARQALGARSSRAAPEAEAAPDHARIRTLFRGLGSRVLRGAWSRGRAGTRPSLAAHTGGDAGQRTMHAAGYSPSPTRRAATSCRTPHAARQAGLGGQAGRRRGGHVDGVRVELNSQQQPRRRIHPCHSRASVAPSHPSINPRHSPARNGGGSSSSSR